jgi:hypothetical protein
VNNPAAVANGSYTFENVQANHTIHVTFLIDTYTVTLPTVTGATVAPTGGSTSPVNHGSSYYFTVMLDDAYNQSAITVKANGVTLTSAAGVYTISDIAENQVVTVEGVQINTYTIISSADGNGTITPLGATTVNHGETLLYTITPDAKHHIKELLVDGVSVAVLIAGDTYEFTEITANHTIHAIFVEDEGVADNDFANIKVYSHQNSVYIKNEGNAALKSAEIMDMTGRLVYRDAILEMKSVITLQVANGVYSVKLTTQNERSSITKLVLFRH